MDQIAPSSQAVAAELSAETFERLLIACFALVLTVTMTFMPKTYIPDRWMIGGWLLFVAGFTVALAGHFLGQFRCHRTRLGAHALAALCFVVGLAFTVYFVSEGDDGGDEDQFVLTSALYIHV